MTEIHWHNQLHSALEEARESKKPLLLYFWTPE